MLVQAMVLFRESLKEWTPVRRDGTANENGEWVGGRFAEELNTCAVLPREFVEGAVRLLVTRFIPLTPKDLERWEMDVEEWMNQEENEDEQWEYGLRVCVPSLFPSIVAHVFRIAVCRACAVDLVGAVQRLRHTNPTSILRQRRRCVSIV